MLFHGVLMRLVMKEECPIQSGSNPELLDALIQGSPVASFVIDSRHRVTHWNRACELVTGVPAHEVIGTSDHWRGFYPEPRPILADYLVAGEVEQAIACYEARNCRPSAIVVGAYEAEGFFPDLGEDGCWMYFTAAPLLDRNGVLLGAVETLQNITARKKAEQQLQCQNQELELQVGIRTRELQSRNDELLELLRQRDELEDRAGVASNTAFAAMNSMGEMGILLQVLQSLNACATQEEVGKVVLDTLAQYGLQGAVQLRMPGRAAQTIPEGARQEAATFDNLLDMGRIVCFHSRMVVNYPLLSVLVSNLPKGDAERAGRVRDNIAILAEAADASLRALDIESGSYRQQEAIAGSLDGIRTVLASIESRQQQSLTESRLAIHGLVDTLEKLFVHLGLTEKQETLLLETVRSSLDGILDAQAGQDDFQVELSDIIKRLAIFA